MSKAVDELSSLSFRVKAAAICEESAFEHEHAAPEPARLTRNATLRGDADAPGARGDDGLCGDACVQPGLHAYHQPRLRERPGPVPPPGTMLQCSTRLPLSSQIATSS